MEALKMKSVKFGFRRTLQPLTLLVTDSFTLFGNVGCGFKKSIGFIWIIRLNDPVMQIP
jgi:hypothetical protein